jgi:hypothetical protein
MFRELPSPHCHFRLDKNLTEPQINKTQILENYVRWNMFIFIRGAQIFQRLGSYHRILCGRRVT